MRLAFTTLGCPEWSLQQIVQNAAHMGFEGVDFRGLQEDIDVSGRPEFTTRLDETRRMFSDAGLVVSGLSISARYAVLDPAERDKHFDETRRHLELAAELGVPQLRVYGGRVPEGHTVDTIMPTLVRNLRLMADEAEGFGVTLALETHDAWTNSAIFARLMAEADHPRVGVLWDLHHPYRLNGEPPETTYANLAPYTVNTHVKDSIATDTTRGYRLTLLGEGDVPVRQMLEMLVEGGYTGYATLEWEKRWHPELPEPEVAFPQYVRQMREWFGG